MGSVAAAPLPAAVAAWIAAASLSEATATAYRRDVLAVARQICDDPADVTVAQLRDGLLADALAGYRMSRSDATVRRACAAWRAFGRWLKQTAGVALPVPSPADPSPGTDVDVLSDPPAGSVAEACRDFLALKRVAPSTRETYRRGLVEVLHQLGADLPLDQLDVGRLTLAFAPIADRHSPATQRRIRSTWSSLFTWLTLQGRWDRPNPATPLEVDRLPKRQPRVVSHPDPQVDEIQVLLDAAADSPFDPARNRWPVRDAAVVGLFAFTGARLGEILGSSSFDPDATGQPRRTTPVRLRDLQPSGDGWGLRIVAKGGDDATLEVVPALQSLLVAWLDDRTARLGPPDPDDWLFVCPDGTAYRRHHLEHRLSTLYRRTGLTPPSGSNVHALRHTLGTRLREAGFDVAVIQQVLRHANLSTTSLYVGADSTAAREALHHDPASRRLGDPGRVASLRLARHLQPSSEHRRQ